MWTVVTGGQQFSFNQWERRIGRKWPITEAVTRHRTLPWLELSPGPGTSQWPSSLLAGTLQSWQRGNIKFMETKQISFVHEKWKSSQGLIINLIEVRQEYPLQEAVQNRDSSLVYRVWARNLIWLYKIQPTYGSWFSMIVFIRSTFFEEFWVHCGNSPVFHSCSQTPLDPAICLPRPGSQPSAAARTAVTTYNRYTDHSHNNTHPCPVL